MFRKRYEKIIFENSFQKHMYKLNISSIKYFELFLDRYLSNSRKYCFYGKIQNPELSTT